MCSSYHLYVGHPLDRVMPEPIMEGLSVELHHLSGCVCGEAVIGVGGSLDTGCGIINDRVMYAFN